MAAPYKAFKITVNWSQVKAMVDGMIREATPAKHFILMDAGALWEIRARKYVHKITKETMRSIDHTAQGNRVNLTAQGGAYYEEERGPPHDFATQALEDLTLEMPNIIENRMAKIFGGGIHR